MTTSDYALRANEALRAGDLRQAIAIADQGLAQGVEHPLMLNLVAHRLEVEGRYDEALQLLHRAHALLPGDPALLNSIGACRTKAGRPTDALAAFDEALARAPGFALPHHGRGLALAALGQREAARAAHQRAIELDPGYPDPLGALAAMAVEDKDGVAGRDYAQRALALEPLQPSASIALASLDLRAGEHAAVVERIDRLVAQGGLSLLHLGSAERLRADALDALDRPTEAAEAYRAANEALRRVYLSGVQEAGVELGVELCQRLGAYFSAAQAQDWRAVHGRRLDPPPAAGHAFLVGFPRSGTTLLEQVLATHPTIRALEERPTLQPDSFFADVAGLDRLASLDAETADDMRDAYWRRVGEFGCDPSGRVFIDKMPLYSIYLPLIAKLFPDARIIFARRDPRDVVLGCFRRRFRPNALVVEYTDLERTAMFYDGVMRLAERYRELLPLTIHVYRYEGLVAEFDGETSSLCGFLGVEWLPVLRDFAQTAEQRDIRTPSADQVRRGLYREGVGQWRKYRGLLTPVAPILAPWVDKFGYPAE